MRCRLAAPTLLLGLAPALAQAGGPLPPGTPPKLPTADVIKLKLSPAPAPVPALKYRLTPELREQKPGNAVFLYYRAFAPEWGVNFHRAHYAKQIEAWEDMRKMPPRDLDVRGDNALKSLDEGARRSYVDWEMTGRLRKDGIGMLLGDVQPLRTYGTLLAARARFEMADRHFDKAVYTLETGLTLGRHLSKGPTLIQGLVGVAVAHNMLEQTEELIQTPGSPNLYWALTDLPTPFIDLREGYQGERLTLDSLFPGVREMLADPKAKPMSKAQVWDLVDRFPELLGLAGASGSRGVSRAEARLGAAVLAAEAYPRARRFLLAQGRDPKAVEALPVLQVALMYEVANYDRLFDDMAKWVGLPYWQARPGLLEAERKLKQAKAAGPQTGTTLAALLLPAMQKVQLAQARTERRIAALRCIEAIRLYAAAHGGKLPARLADVKVVPTPADPITGRAFQYTAEGGRAVLYAGPLPGEEPGPQNAVRYELSVRP
jgi:hypothetical protein